MTRPRTSVPTRAVLVLALLVPLLGLSRAEAQPQASSAAVAPGAAAADGPEHRRSEMELDLVSRTYNPGTDNWTIVTEATLSSNRVCLPIAFNCIVGELPGLSQVSLAELKCQSLLWNHLLVFRDHCLKQVLFAGYDQKFEFTFTTDPGVNSGSVKLGVEFGRGFLPVTFQQLAKAELTVNLDVTLDIAKSCPTEVESGGSLKCEIVLSYPTGPVAGPTIGGIALEDTPDSALAALLGTQALSFGGGSGTWVCGGTGCSDGELDPGQSATFVFSAPVPPTSIGGDGVNSASVGWSSPSPGGPLAVSDPVVVVGNGDTRLELGKASTDTQAVPGQKVSWTITLVNAGPLPATDVLLTDTPPADLEGLTMAYRSGVGDWTCSATNCKTSTMPVGTTTFTASGTVASGASPDSTIVNEVGVTWANDILGPDFPVTAGSAIPVVAGATTTTVPGARPAGEQPGAPISFVG